MWLKQLALSSLYLTVLLLEGATDELTASFSPPSVVSTFKSLHFPSRRLRLMKEVSGAAAAFTVFVSWASAVPKLCLSALQKTSNQKKEEKKRDKFKRERVRWSWLSNSAAQLDFFSRLALRDPVKQSARNMVSLTQSQSHQRTTGGKRDIKRNCWNPAVLLQHLRFL